MFVSENLASLRNLVTPPNLRILVNPQNPWNLVNPANPWNLVNPANPWNLVNPANPWNLVNRLNLLNLTNLADAQNLANRESSNPHRFCMNHVLRRHQPNDLIERHARGFCDFVGGIEFHCCRPSGQKACLRFSAVSP